MMKLESLSAFMKVLIWGPTYFHHHSDVSLGHHSLFQPLLKGLLWRGLSTIVIEVTEKWIERNWDLDKPDESPPRFISNILLGI